MNNDVCNQVVVEPATICDRGASGGRLCAAAGVLATSAIGLWVAALGATPAPLPPQAIKRAIVQSLQSHSGTPVLTVRYVADEIGEERVLLAGPGVPRPYREVVVPSWSRPCVGQVGSEVLVAQAEGLAVAVLENANGKPSAAAAVDWRVCYARLYFNLTTTAASGVGASFDLRRALGISLRLISESGTNTQLWIKGTAWDVLSMYDPPASMIDAAVRRDQPKLVNSVQELYRLRSEMRSQVVLAGVVPFRYQSRAERPVGGGWPYFVVTLYRDRGGQEPLKILDYSADLR